MIEQEYLKYCLTKIEEKLNWKNSKNWKESDYIKLSNLISTESTISISPHTLKRLFGKLKYNEHYNPQHATKDALSKYLGYTDWDDFIIKNNKVVEHNSINNKKIFIVPKFKKAAVIIPIVLIIAMLVFIFSSNFNSKTETFSFNLTDSIGVVPFTVSTVYDISELKADSLSVDFSFNHPIHGLQELDLPKTGSIINFTYQIPGYYTVSLKNDQQQLIIKKVLAMSEDWDSYINYESKLNRFWLDNEIDIQYDLGDSLYISTKELDIQGFDVNPVFYITHRLYKQFNIDGDNFEFETKFKNTKALGGISCYDVVFKIICENNLNYISLMENGCSQFSGIKFGETLLRGIKENLSSFKINLKDWNVLKVVVQNKRVSVSLNEVLIYEGTYEKTNGSIVGIENLLKGSGMIDYIKVQDLNTKQVFFEDFSNAN